VVGWCLLLRFRRGGVAALAWGRAAGAGCRGWGTVRAVSQKRQASTGGRRAPGPVPVAVAAALSQGRPGVAAFCGPGGTHVGGGGRSPAGQGTRIGLQPPNTALEATGHSGHRWQAWGCTVWPAPQLGR